MLEYFPYNVQISRTMRERLRLDEVPTDQRAEGRAPGIIFIRQVANRLNSVPDRAGRPVQAGLLNMYGLMARIFRYLIDTYVDDNQPGILETTMSTAGYDFTAPVLLATLTSFAELFPGSAIIDKKETPATFIAGDDAAHSRKRALVRELLLLRLAAKNPALDHFRELFDDAGLAASSPYRPVVAAVEEHLAKAPPFDPFDLSLPELLLAPIKASPHSLPGQMEYIKNNWSVILPPDLLAEILTAMDIVQEEERQFWGGPGKPKVLEFPKGRRKGAAGYDYPEYERFSQDADWMSNVVMIAKMVYVWLDQLSKKYGRPIHRLDHIPDEELDLLARWGFSSLWLIGLWERSSASQKIKQISGNPEAAASAYSLYDYVIAHDLGGEEALQNLKERAGQRGIRLASDMVPNHTGIYSKWTVEHPDWFVQLDYPPYPAYSFNGPDLSFSPEISLHIEDGYWDKRDAAVVFKHYDHRDGRTRYIYHGNDGTSTPWNDTAQLNYLLPQVREAVIQTILHVARQFPVIRFDAAMTLAKKHYQRLWYPQPGHGSGVPSRAEHGMNREEFDAAFPSEFWREVVDRVAVEAPDTLLLAEAFWLMEGYFVRTLGMHRVYNSAFMNMLKMEENAKYRQTVKNVLEFNPEILKRFVNFMNNPDERTAVEQFGKEGKYFGACVLLVTMPGLPMFGHGQIEGFHEKYGMEYRKSYWDEPVDEHLVAVHEARIFPLMRKRWLFSGSENFVFYDFFAGSVVDENVFAYSNRKGEERGIILYNNRYGETAGWIRISAARAVKIDSGETVLRQATLGEALGFNPDSRYYYAFRDYATGLEYIRAGRELCDKGMYVEISAFEYHAFLDFREICDDEFGTWGKLCHTLNGRPVESLDEEAKRVQYGAVIDCFREVVEETAPLLAGDLEKEAVTKLRSALGRFYAALNEHAMCSGDCEAISGEVLGEVAAVSLVASLKGRGKADKKAAPPVVSLELPADRLVLAVYLVFHLAGKLAAVEDYPKTAASWLDELGLARAFGDLFLQAPAAGGKTQPQDREEAVGLLRLLLSRQRFFEGWEMEEAHARFRDLFTDSVAREFLRCHWSGGFEWFNKERFELLLAWLATVEAIRLARAAGKGKRLPSAATSLREEVLALCDTALEAGYQPGRFLSLLENRGEK
ncbi:MAG: hypothetical protein FD174_1845 [Geobacteraceae bacterium]|nr:MAG: hypothetical protein FD174_1845 [Geobacteraceae bacterium]